MNNEKIKLINLKSIETELSNKYKEYEGISLELEDKQLELNNIKQELDVKIEEVNHWQKYIVKQNRRRQRKQKCKIKRTCIISKNIFSRDK